jgi:MFS family permease
MEIAAAFAVASVASSAFPSAAMATPHDSAVANLHPVELYHEPYADGSEPSLRFLGRLTDRHGLLQAVMTQLTGGVFLTGYALALGASSSVIGLLAGVPFMVKVSQLYLSWRIERAGHWRRSALEGALLSRAALLVAAIGPLAAGPGAGAWVLVATIAGSALGATVFEMAFQTWMAELVPVESRGEFWGRRARVVGVAGLVASLVAAFGIDRAGHHRPPTLAEFAVVMAVGALAGLAGLAFIRRVPSPRRHRSRVEPISLRGALSRPVHDENYRRLVIFIGLWGLAGGIVAPFFTVYMLETLHLSFLVVTILSSITAATISLVQLYWGRLGDHFGSKTVLRAGTYVIALTPLLWLFTMPHRVWLIVVIQLLSGFGWGAYHLSLTNLVLKLSPPDARPSYLATFGASQGLAEAVAPVLGGFALDAMVRLAGLSWLASFQIMVVISFVLFAGSTPLLGAIREPGGTTVGRMIRVMGRFRSMNAEYNGDFLFDYVYTHLARIADFVAREETAGEDTRRAPSGSRR